MLGVYSLADTNTPTRRGSVIVPFCISIEKDLAEKTIRELRRKQLIDDEYLIVRAGDSVIIPVKARSTGDLNLSFTKLSIFECSPPAREKIKVNLPSLDIVGDIVILRENVLEFRQPENVISAIKQVYPRIRAIWVKKETVNEFRVPALELLWGEKVKEAIVKEYGLRMKVRLGEVYFNPRLAEEHRRVAQLAKDGEVVVDIFSGTGGFALHIASLRKTLVIANDLNPVAYELLIENIKLNWRRLKGTIIPLNVDALELPEVLRNRSADRIIADLPTRSMEYWEVYERVLKPRGILHLYALVFKDISSLESKLLGLFSHWTIKGCKSVLEYAPRVTICRCDLVKPNYV